MNLDWSVRDFPGTVVVPPPFHGLEANNKLVYPKEGTISLDMVNSPSHYTKGSIECIDAIAEVVKHLNGMEAMCTGNAIKYLWRWKHKNGIEDLKKAVWYIQRMIDGIDAN